MKGRIITIVLIINLILALVIPAMNARAEDPFPLPDKDADGLANTLETAGWYSLAGGPFVTDPNDADSDNDGLTDGEEKLFNTNPLDSHSPGLAVRYESSFKTKQYFSTTDTAYISMIQGGDRYLMTEAMVVRRGATFNIAGPATGTLTITGTSMTALTPVKDPARGGWTVTLPAAGTVGAYTATVTDGAWTKSMPIYVIFELPTPATNGITQSEIDYFLYDDDPANKKDEVAVFWSDARMAKLVHPARSQITASARTGPITWRPAMPRHFGPSSSPKRSLSTTPSRPFKAKPRRRRQLLPSPIGPTLSSAPGPAR